MSKSTSEVRAKIMHILTHCGDEGMTINVISNRLKLSASTLRPILTDLCGSLKIRSGKQGKYIYYWIPSDAVLKAEEELRQERIIKPLVIDKARRELYERINAERNAIRSIG